MNKQVYIHTAFTILSAKKFVEPLALALDKKKYDVEVWIDPFINYFDYKTEFNLPVQLLDLRINWNLIGCSVDLLRLYRLFKKTKPSVVETHTSIGSLLPLIAAKVAGIERRIYHNHGIPFVGYKGILKWILYVVEFLNCLLATEIMTVSKGMQRIYGKMFPVNFHVRLPDPGSACGLPDSYYVDLESMQSIKVASAKSLSSNSAVAQLHPNINNELVRIFATTGIIIAIFSGLPILLRNASSVVQKRFWEIWMENLLPLQ